MKERLRRWRWPEACKGASASLSVRPVMRATLFFLFMSMSSTMSFTTRLRAAHTPCCAVLCLLLCHAAVPCVPNALMCCITLASSCCADSCRLNHRNTTKAVRAKARQLNDSGSAAEAQMKCAYLTLWLAVATEAPRVLKKPVSLSTSYRSLQPRRNSATSMLPARHAQVIRTQHARYIVISINLTIVQHTCMLALGRSSPCSAAR